MMAKSATKKIRDEDMEPPPVAGAAGAACNSVYIIFFSYNPKKLG
jgi:hypothetical protein